MRSKCIILSLILEITLQVLKKKKGKFARVPEKSILIRHLFQCIYVLGMSLLIYSPVLIIASYEENDMLQ